jgi:DNA-binding protein YbaB
LSNDAMRHQVTEVMALVQEQLSDIAAAQRRQAELTAKGAAADGMVEVTVDAAGRVIETVVDESYLDSHEFDELGGHFTEAAQAAAGEVARRIAEIMAPISERRRSLLSMSEGVDGAPDLPAAAPPWLDPFAPRSKPRTRGDDGTMFPTVRR